MRPSQWAGVLGVAIGFCAGRAAPLPSDVTPDHLVSGELSNGVRYAVLPHAPPAGGVSLRLVVLGGSAEERTPERGFAHFIEHLAFCGTTHHPQRTVVGFLEALGLQAGADINAATMVSSTVFKLDLPDSSAARFGDALQVLRDDADGLQFDPTEISREKRVIVAEMQARDSGSRRIGRLVESTLFAGTPVADHDPLGDKAAIEAATPDALRNFYRRVYRASRMVVVVVGAVDPRTIRTEIERQFGSLPDDSGFRRVALHPKTNQLSPRMLVNPAAVGASLLWSNVLVRDTSTDSGTEIETDRAVAIALLNRRLQERRERVAGAQIGTLAAMLQPGVDGTVEVCSATAETTAAGWSAGLSVLVGEISRAREQGFTRAEIAEASAAILGHLRHEVDTLPMAPNANLAAGIALAYVGGEPWSSPEEQLHRVEHAVSGLDEIRVIAAMRQMFPPNRGYLFVMAATPLPNFSQQFTAAWRAGAHAPAPAATDATPAGELKWAYTSFGTPGTLAHRTTDAGARVDMAQFANGVRVNVRHSETGSGRFMLIVRIGNGLADLPRYQAGFGTVAQLLVNANGLNRHTQAETGRLLALHDMVGAFTTSEGCGVWTFAGPASELRFGLQFVSARVTDTVFEMKHDLAVEEGLAGWMKAYSAEPSAVAMTTALKVAAGNDVRFDRVPDRRLLTAAQFAEIKRWIRQCWFEGPMEIGIVADLPADDVLAIAAETVGSLTPRRERLEPTPSQRLIAKPLASEKSVSVPTQANAAVATVVWPLATTAGVAERYAEQLAADVLAERLRTRIREQMGETYSPTTVVWRSVDQPSFGFYAVTLTVPRERAEEAAGHVVSLADALAQSGATESELAQVRIPRVAGSAGELRDDRWWLTKVAAAQSQPEALDLAKQHATGYANVTLGQVNAALKLLSRREVTAVVAEPARGLRDPVGTAAALPTGH